MNLSEAEQNAIDWLKREGGSMLISKIPDRNERDCFGDIQPGMGVFKKLEKKDLVYFTDESEEPFEDIPGFTFTPEVYLVTS